MDINKRNRNDLKAYFKKNSIPTEGQFAELIDGLLNQKDDGIARLSPAEPLCIQAAADTAGLKKAINFFGNFQDPSPAWTLLLNPPDSVNAAISKPGFCISDGQGISRLFIDSASGYVGIGTTNPQAKLDIEGGALLGYETFQTNFGIPLKSGFYQGVNPVGDVPDTSSDWTHLIVARHSNISTNQQLQIASTFSANDNDRLFFRKIVSGDLNPNNPSWIELATRGSNSFSGNQQFLGAIIPSFGSTEATGIMFPKEPGGGYGDAAWIRYYARTGEACTLEIGTSNDADDHIALMPSGNVGIGTLEPKAKLEVMEIVNGLPTGLQFGGQHTPGITAGGVISSCDSNGTVRPLTLQSKGGNVGIGTVTPNGKLDIANLVRFGLDEGGSGLKSISFVRDTSDEINAGKIAYKGFGTDSLCIVGAGTHPRKIMLFDNVVVNGTLQANGILFPLDPGGGGGDTAWIKYYSRNPTDSEVPKKEQMTLEIGVSDNTNDHIALMPSGGLGIGTNEPENADGWSRVVDVLGSAHTKLSLRTPTIDARVLAHPSGWWGSLPGMVVGTKTTHALSLATNANTRITIDANGLVGIGVTNPGFRLDVAGSVNVSESIRVNSTSSPPAKNAYGVPANTSGIWFKDNPGGGGFDAAWIQYYARTGEACTLEIGTSNDADDHIALMPSGNVGIGITTPNAKLHVIGDTWISGGITVGAGSDNVVRTRHVKGKLSGQDGDGDLYLNYDNGNNVLIGTGNTSNKSDLIVAGSVTIGVDLNVTRTAYIPGGAWTDSSDERLKQHIRPLEGALDRLLKLRGMEFEWKEPEKQGNLTGTQMGLVAQEVETVFPEWVGVDGQGYRTLTIRGFEALAIEAIKELKAENESLKKRCEDLEAKL